MSKPSRTSFFDNAHNVVLNDTTIISNTTINNHDTLGSGLNILYQAIPRSTSATYDSSERYPPPNCHPKTRELVVREIVEFVNEPQVKHPILWLHAPFGHGKSAVMQTAMETLQGLGQMDRVGGGFFFGRNKEGRDKAHYLLPIIMFQVAKNIPGMREYIRDAIEADPTLPLKAIHAQLVPLLVIPFRQGAPPSHPLTIFIDGLDECDTIVAQRSILGMIADAICVHQLPVRFVVASRPETHILNEFRAKPLSSITHITELDDDFEKMVKYLRSEFDVISKSRADELPSGIKPWPPDSIIRDLTRRASGQYLFASTVVRFVGDEFENPVDQLQVLLTRHPRQQAAFSNMDEIYTQILSRTPLRLRDSLLRLLSALVVLHSGTLAALSDLLELKASDITTILRSLRAVVEVQELPSSAPPFNLIARHFSPNIKIRHISLCEFLTNKTRSGEFWVDVDGTTTSLVRRADGLLYDGISSMIDVHISTWRNVSCLTSLGTLGDPSPFDGVRRNVFSAYLSKFTPRNTRLLRLQVAESLPRSVRSVIALLERNQTDRHRIYQMMVAHALGEWLQFADTTGSLLLLRYLYRCGDRIPLRGTIEGFSNFDDQLSLEKSLSILDNAAAFLDFVLKPGGGWNKVQIFMDEVIVGILHDETLLVTDVYLKVREARILALNDSYQAFLVKKDEGLFIKAIWNAISKGRDFLTLRTGCDSLSSSATTAFIISLHSRASQALILDPPMTILENAQFCIPLLTFICRRYTEACMIGTEFRDLRKMLNHLCRAIIKAGALSAAFGRDSHKLRGGTILLYNSLCAVQRHGIAWWNLISKEEHTAIIEFFLRKDVISQSYRVKDPDLKAGFIHWFEHFSRASYSVAIHQELGRLQQGTSETLERFAQVAIEQESIISFVAGISVWKTKYSDIFSDETESLNDLCIRLWEHHETHVYRTSDALLSPVRIFMGLDRPEEVSIDLG